MSEVKIQIARECMLGHKPCITPLKCQAFVEQKKREGIAAYKAEQDARGEASSDDFPLEDLPALSDSLKAKLSQIQDVSISFHLLRCIIGQSWHSSNRYSELSRSA